MLRHGEFANSLVRDWQELARTSMFDDPLPGDRQHKNFRAHRHDQAVLSILAKQRGVKTFPLPVAGHEAADVWAWEAGYCNLHAWPFAPGRYSVHYGSRKSSSAYCRKTQKQPAPLADYHI